VSAGAGWLGASTRGANVAATGAVLGVLMLLAPALHRLERRTTEALALMVGGGLGNLLSLATRDTGVPDFLRVEHAGAPGCSTWPTCACWPASRG
jgi:lipoprotein signal peptidase